jgi:hypothetical protein
MSSLHLEYIACTLERSPCDLGNDVTNKLSYFMLAWSFVGMSLFLSGRVATLTRSRLNLFRKRCEWVSIVSRLTHVVFSHSYFARAMSSSVALP